MGKEHVEHSIIILKQYYEIKEDWTGSKYIKLNLDWDCENKKVHISNAAHVKQMMMQFQHSTFKKQQKEQFTPDDKAGQAGIFSY